MNRENYTELLNAATNEQKILLKMMIDNASEIEKQAFMSMMIGVSDNTQNEIVTKMFIETNIFNRNRTTITITANKLFDRDTNKQVYYKIFTESKSVNIVIYAPPQVGKTDAMIDIIFAAIDKGIPVLFTTDNKCNQMEQFDYRLRKRVQNEKKRIDIINMNEMSYSKFEKKIENCFERRDTNFIVMCLDNAASVTKVARLLERLSNKQEFELIKQLCMIHDEADTVTKDEDVINSNMEQAVVHRAWIDMIKMLSKKIDVKRFHTSATPENILMKYDVLCKDVYSLEVSSNYKGWKDIEFVDTTDFDLDDLLLKLNEEIIRVKIENSLEVLIWGIDRFNNDQDNMLEPIARMGSITHTYNHYGIKAMILDEIIFMEFYRLLWEKIPMEKWDPDTKDYKNDINDYVKRNGYIFTLHKDIPLREFYDLCKLAGESCVVTIGKGMIGRSTSLVGGMRDKPFAASVLFANPSKESHQVSNCQFKSRICGTARPELKRRLYAPKQSTDYFVQFSKNQELRIVEFQKIENENELTKNIVNNMEFDSGTSNKIDRPVLKLQKLKIKSEPEESIDNVDLNRLRVLLNSDTLVGKMIRYLYDNDDYISHDELMNGVEYNGSKSSFINNIANGRSSGAQYGFIWNDRNETIKLRDAIRNVIRDRNI